MNKEIPELYWSESEALKKNLKNEKKNQKKNKWKQWKIRESKYLLQIHHFQSIALQWKFGFDVYQVHFIHNEIWDHQMTIDQPIDLKIIIVFTERVNYSFSYLKQSKWEELGFVTLFLLGINLVTNFKCFLLHNYYKIIKL